MLLEDCVIWCPTSYQGYPLLALVKALGARYSAVLDSYCTHVVCSNANTHRYIHGGGYVPEIPIVHPSWLWKCYWRMDFCTACVEPYLLDFFLDARRMGTVSTLGTRELFYQEMPHMQAVIARCPDWLDDKSPHWPFVCRKLQNTAFWGVRVRQVNWARRWPILAHVLRTPSILPLELRKMVVQFF
jgi:hypothetical protein